ncbi:MAG TPA: hypothetical protein VGM83_05060 [Devosiaceae bacterium]|jgi:hypothetical protein
MRPYERILAGLGMKTRSFLLLTLRRRAYRRALSTLPRINGPALILGSSPTAVKPVSYRPDWFVVSINGSQLVGESFGIPVPDLTVMRDGITIPSLHSDTVWAALKGKRTKHLVSSIASQRDRGIGAKLASYGYHADGVTEVDRHTRGAIIAEMTGRYQVSITNRESLSNGIYAALLACKLGANPVVMAGFSFSQTGLFFGGTTHFNREHLSGDALACQAIVKRGLPIYTEDETFATESGLRLWPSKPA